MLEHTAIVAPVIMLVIWTLIMWVWMYATRIPAIQAMGMKLDGNLPRGEQMATLPANVRWKADNYNHLMEQPTIFYAIALALAVLGEGDGVNAYLAWGYVILRMLHSMFQAMVNKIHIRFMLFALSNIPLFALAFNAAIVVMK